MLSLLRTIILRGGFAACFALMLFGCERGTSPSEPTRDTGRFGDPYEVLTNEGPDAPEEPPAIVSESLYVQVQYPGGCEDHDFDLDYEAESDTTRIWLRHDNNGDSCEAMVYDRFGFELPDRALESATILLLNPAHDTPHILRWGGETGEEKEKRSAR